MDEQQRSLGVAGLMLVSIVMFLLVMTWIGAAIGLLASIWGLFLGLHPLWAVGFACLLIVTYSIMQTLARWEARWAGDERLEPGYDWAEPFE